MNLRHNISNELNARIMNLSVKKFRSMVRKKSSKIDVFQLVPKEQYRTKRGSSVKDPSLKEIL